MQCLTQGRKGKIHPPIIRGERGTERKIYVFETERERQRWTDRTKTTERLKQTGRHKKETDGWRDRESEKVRQTHRQTEGIDCTP